MKVLMIDGFDKYMYPDGINDLAGFMEYVENSDTMFSEMFKLDDENCCDPYYIREEAEKVYMNFNAVSTIQEADVYVLSAKEYDAKLSQTVKTVCRGCEMDGDADFGCDSLKSKREHIDIENNICMFRDDAEEMARSAGFLVDDDTEPEEETPQKGSRGKIVPFKNKKDDE